MDWLVISTRPEATMEARSCVTFAVFVSLCALGKLTVVVVGRVCMAGDLSLKAATRPSRCRDGPLVCFVYHSSVGF